MKTKMLYAAASLALSAGQSSTIHGVDCHTQVITQDPSDKKGDKFKAALKAAYDEGWCDTPTQAGEVIAGVEDEIDAEEAADTAQIISDLTAKNDELQKLNDKQAETFEKHTKQLKDQKAEIAELKKVAKSDQAKIQDLEKRLELASQEIEGAGQDAEADAAAKAKTDAAA